MDRQNQQEEAQGADVIDLTLVYIDSERSQEVRDKLEDILPDDMKGVAAFSTRHVHTLQDILEVCGKNGVQHFPCLIKEERDTMKKNAKVEKTYHYYDDIFSTAESVRTKILGLRT